MSNMGWMNKIIFGLCLLVGASELSAQNLPLAIDEMPPHSSYSILVRDLTTGEDLFSVAPERSLISASLMKIVTTATALEVLGPDYQFTTRFWIDGAINNGTLEGNLIVEGGGDPTQGSKYFEDQSPEIVLEKVSGFLKQSGIKQISGKILLDQSWIAGTRFPSRRLWEDMGNYYGAPPSALSWKDNSFKIVLRSSSRTGVKCDVVDVIPPMSEINIISNVVSASHQKDSAYIYGVPGMKNWEVRGSIPVGRSAFSIKGALPYPGVTFAKEIAENCLDQPNTGIFETNPSVWKKNARLIGEIKSPRLAEIIREINQHSLNLAADHLLLALGKNSDFPQLNDWDKGLEVIRKFWKQKIEQEYYINIKDGSGVAPLNTLSSVFLVEVLDYMYQKSANAEAFKNSLAQSGRSGTLKYIWNHGPLKDKIRGKSGSMQDVMCYSGYIFSDKKSPLAFSVMVNHFGIEGKDMRDIIEKILYQAVSEKL